jgi:hypothetical protein
MSVGGRTGIARAANSAAKPLEGNERERIAVPHERRSRS